MIYAVRDSYEPELMCLERLVPAGGVVFDAGANCGIYTLVASRVVGPHGRVIAFEPGLQCFSVLERNVKLNALTNACPFRMALSGIEGVSRLFHHPHGPNSFSLGADEDWRADFEEVPTTTIDLAFGREGLRSVDLIKMDVEGAEELCLGGAERTIASFRPTVLFEINARAASRLGLTPLGTLEALRRYGYRFWEASPTGDLTELSSPPSSGNVIAIHPRN